MHCSKYFIFCKSFASVALSDPLNIESNSEITFSWADWWVAKLYKVKDTAPATESWPYELNNH